MNKAKAQKHINRANNNIPPEDLDDISSPPRSLTQNGVASQSVSGGHNEVQFTRRLSAEEKAAAFAEWDRIASARPALIEDLDFQRIVHVFGKLRSKRRRRTNGPQQHRTSRLGY